MRLGLLASATLLGVGCAGSQPVSQKEAFPGTAPATYAPRTPEGPAPRQAQQRQQGGDGDLRPEDLRALDPKAYARRHEKPVHCEEAARRVYRLNRDKGWGVLRACIDKGNFTVLKPLLDGTWDDELRSRPDASLVLMKLVASRGGDVNGDLDKLRQRKVPLFDLQAASKYPDVYRGRLLMVRAEVADVRTAGGKTTLKLTEKGFSSYEKWKDTSYDRQHGGVFGTRYSERKFGFNEVRETGLVALARLGSTDPFLVPGRDFLFLARFDGMRTSDNEWGEAEEAMPVLSIVNYLEPAAQIVE